MSKGHAQLASIRPTICRLDDLSVITIGAIRKGIEAARAGTPDAAAKFEH
jgi:hypothetical protein